jgi:large subunit ribosomal protein L28
MRATKRKFKPNVFIKRVYSETLDAMIKFHLTTAALRSIDKAGGLDNYLLCNDKITEGEGLVIKKKILKRLRNEARKSRIKESVDEMEANVV